MHLPLGSVVLIWLQALDLIHTDCPCTTLKIFVFAFFIFKNPAFYSFGRLQSQDNLDPLRSEFHLKKKKKNLCVVNLQVTLA